MREYDVYSGYYCGLCKCAGRHYGQHYRFVLSYDFAFLAILLDSLLEGETPLKKEHCIIHPIKKRFIAEETEGLKYACDIMLVLAYYKLLDDYTDDKNLPAGIGSLSFRKAFKKISKNYEELCVAIKDFLGQLSAIEKEKSGELDRVQEPFSKIMEIILVKGGEKVLSEKQLKALSHLGFHLGKWIYLMDAFDDVQENITKGTYNPLIYRFKYNLEEFQGESVQEFRNRILETVEFNLLHYLSELSKAFELLDIKKNKNLLENIIYMGLLRKTETLLNEAKEPKEKGI